ncbi:MAG: type II toxin-antitoxin system HigB family toxin [Symploca sp. SIO3E6]|nr:type II toxin-antitoxin system HigB family toxin [Caldora sp. SIO3E6]
MVLVDYKYQKIFIRHVLTHTKSGIDIPAMPTL